MTLEEKQELEDFCNARYVRKDDCIERKEHMEKKLANDDKRIEMIAKDVGAFKKFGWILVGEGAAALVALLINLIVK